MSAVPRSAEEARDLLQSALDRVRDLEAWREGISAWKDTTNSRIDRLERENDRLHDELDDLRDQLADLETSADQAMVVASAGHDPKSRSKKGTAFHITRNELVRRVAMGTSQQDVPLTINDVQTRAEPETVLKWQTVRDAFDDLREEWPQFRDTTHDGQQALTISRADVPTSLARAVEVDLDRDDLAKRLVGDEPKGGRPA